MQPHFSSPFNFGGIPNEYSSYEKSNVVILPVPFDATTTYQSGARNGPRAIIEASRNMELFDEELKTNISSLGICTLDEIEILTDPRQMAKRVEEACSKLIADGKKIVVLGGEHSISAGAAKACMNNSQSFGVLQLDAHADLKDEYLGSKYNHACVMRRIAEFAQVTQVGIRSLSEEEDGVIATSNLDVFSMNKLIDGWQSRVAEILPENVYVTVDLDVFDPSIMPSVGTPEPGGLLWRDVIKLVKEIGANRNVVGFDITELMPVPGHLAPNYMAARLAMKMIGNFWIKKE